MRKNRIQFIIILMSIALTGLIFFQVYWINNAIDIEREEFNRRAFEAMNRVVNKLEKAETVFYLADRTSEIYHKDSVPQVIYREEEQIVKKFQFSDTIIEDHKKTFRIDRRLGNSPYHFKESLIVPGDITVDLTPKTEVIPVPPPPPDFDSIHSSIKKNLNKITNQEAIIKQVMKDVLKPNIDIKSRISEPLLRKYLNEELKNNGLHLKYYFGVKTNQENKLLFVKQSKRDEIVKSEFKVKLFPNDIFGGNDYLMLEFPEKYSFILRKTWITLLASVFLIGIILYCFAYAVYTLINQKKLSEMKNDFINNMTHEFKTPIATVALTCEALSDNDINKDQKLVQRYISVIKDENRRLGQQVEKVLQIASLDKKDYKLNLKVLDLHDIIRSAIDNISIQVKNRGGDIIEELKASNTEVLADELHLINIIYNLLDNANKYSPEFPKIEISTINTAGEIQIKIKDYGQGISKEHLGRIFEKFYRVPTGNVHDVKGFGLGLAYVKSMVEVQGGSIKTTSELGKGSEFVIYFPLHTA